MNMAAAVTGIPEAFAKITGAIGRIKVVEHMVVSSYGDELVDLEKEMCPVFEGVLRDSITKRETSADTVEIGPTAPYALWVEDGSPPHTPPKGSLAKWARAKGMSEEAIVRKIENRGTLPHPFVKPAVERLKGRGWENLRHPAMGINDVLVGVTVVRGRL